MDANEIHRLADFEEWYWWHRARQSIVTRLLRRFAGGVRGRVLDVGCGAGATSLALRAHGRVLGVDFGRAAVEAARARDLEVAQMEATRLGVRDRSADIAVALGVLEHLDDDLGARVAHLQLRCLETHFCSTTFSVRTPTPRAVTTSSPSRVRYSMVVSLNCNLPPRRPSFSQVRVGSTTAVSTSPARSGRWYS